MLTLLINYFGCVLGNSWTNGSYASYPVHLNFKDCFIVMLGYLFVFQDVKSRLHIMHELHSEVK